MLHTLGQKTFLKSIQKHTSAHTEIAIVVVHECANSECTKSKMNTKSIHEISQKSLNVASAKKVFKIVGGTSSQNIYCSTNIQMHAPNIRSLTIKVGKDAVCGGLSAAGRGRPSACSNEVTLCGSSMTLRLKPECRSTSRGV